MWAVRWGKTFADIDNCPLHHYFWLESSCTFVISSSVYLSTGSTELELSLHGILRSRFSRQSEELASTFVPGSSTTFSRVKRACSPMSFHFIWAKRGYQLNWNSVSFSPTLCVLLSLCWLSSLNSRWNFLSTRCWTIPLAWSLYISKTLNLCRQSIYGCIVIVEALFVF